MSWRVLPRGLVALFGSLTLSIAFTLAIGQPSLAILTWMFTFGFAWVAWVWPADRKTSRTIRWYIETAGLMFVWIVVWLLVVSLLVLLLT